MALAAAPPFALGQAIPRGFLRVSPPRSFYYYLFLRQESDDDTLDIYLSMLLTSIDHADRVDKAIFSYNYMLQA